jgi:hypothetical protein
MRISLLESKGRFIFRICLTFAVVLGNLTMISSASADNLKDCRIQPSQWNIVSLGFPLRNERLANFKNPKVLVLPFQLKGEPPIELSQSERLTFAMVAQDVRDFSANLNSPEIIINKPIEVPWTSSELDEVKINVQNTWGKDFSNSTYGFVEKVIKFSDSVIDFRGIDAVLLYGKSSSAKQEIAEAMMFTSGQMLTNNAKRADGAKWFDPISTNEGLISNFSLLYNRAEREVITHELMHLYGLTDLYGSATGPGRLSLMSNNTLNLLSYEKWVLGWLPGDEVQCLTNVMANKIHKISIDNSKANQVVVIRTSEQEDYVIETTKVGGKRYLAFYSINNDLRPPLTLFQESGFNQSGGIEIEDYTVLGTQLRAPKFTLFVSSFDSSSTTLHLAPTSLVSSNEFKEIATKTWETRSKIVQEIEQRFAAEAKAAAEKVAAESKMAAEKAAAESKAPASKLSNLKKVTITCTKGKIVKKVIGIKPKCPSGFKKR